MGLSDFLSGSKSTYTGTVQCTAHVMSSSSNGTAFFGIRFNERDEWIRVHTNDLTLAASVAFLMPGEVVSIETRGKFKEKDNVWHGLVRVRAVSCRDELLNLARSDVKETK